MPFTDYVRSSLARPVFLDVLAFSILALSFSSLSPARFRVTLEHLHRYILPSPTPSSVAEEVSTTTPVVQTDDVDELVAKLEHLVRTAPPDDARRPHLERALDSLQHLHPPSISHPPTTHAHECLSPRMLGLGQLISTPTPGASPLFAPRSPIPLGMASPLLLGSPLKQTHVLDPPGDVGTDVDLSSSSLQLELHTSPGLAPAPAQSLKTPPATPTRPTTGTAATAAVTPARASPSANRPAPLNLDMAHHELDDPATFLRALLLSPRHEHPPSTVSAVMQPLMRQSLPPILRERALSLPVMLAAPEHVLDNPNSVPVSIDVAPEEPFLDSNLPAAPEPFWDDEPVSFDAYGEDAQAVVPVAPEFDNTSSFTDTEPAMFPLASPDTMAHMPAYSPELVAAMTVYPVGPESPAAGSESSWDDVDAPEWTRRTFDEADSPDDYLTTSVLAPTAPVDDPLDESRWDEERLASDAGNIPDVPEARDVDDPSTANIPFVVTPRALSSDEDETDETLPAELFPTSPSPPSSPEEDDAQQGTVTATEANTSEDLEDHDAVPSDSEPSSASAFSWCPATQQQPVHPHHPQLENDAVPPLPVFTGASSRTTSRNLSVATSSSSMSLPPSTAPTSPSGSDDEDGVLSPMTFAPPSPGLQVRASEEGEGEVLPAFPVLGAGVIDMTFVTSPLSEGIMAPFVIPMTDDEAGSEQSEEEDDDEPLTEDTPTEAAPGHASQASTTPRDDSKTTSAPAESTHNLDTDNEPFLPASELEAPAVPLEDKFEFTPPTTSSPLLSPVQLPELSLPDPETEPPSPLLDALVVDNDSVSPLVLFGTPPPANVTVELEDDVAPDISETPIELELADSKLASSQDLSDVAVRDEQHYDAADGKIEELQSPTLDSLLGPDDSVSQFARSASMSDESMAVAARAEAVASLSRALDVLGDVRRRASAQNLRSPVTSAPEQIIEEEEEEEEAEQKKPPLERALSVLRRASNTSLRSAPAPAPRRLSRRLSPLPDDVRSTFSSHLDEDDDVGSDVEADADADLYPPPSPSPSTLPVPAFVHEDPFPSSIRRRSSQRMSSGALLVVPFPNEGDGDDESEADIAPRSLDQILDEVFPLAAPDVHPDASIAFDFMYAEEDGDDDRAHWRDSVRFPSAASQDDIAAVRSSTETASVTASRGRGRTRSGKFMRRVVDGLAKLHVPIGSASANASTVSLAPSTPNRSRDSSTGSPKERDKDTAKTERSRTVSLFSTMSSRRTAMTTPEPTDPSPSSTHGHGKTERRRSISMFKRRSRQMTSEDIPPVPPLPHSRSAPQAMTISTITPEKNRRQRTLSVFSTLSSRSHVRHYDTSGADEQGRVASSSFESGRPQTTRSGSARSSMQPIESTVSWGELIKPHPHVRSRSPSPTGTAQRTRSLSPRRMSISNVVHHPPTFHELRPSTLGSVRRRTLSAGGADHKQRSVSWAAPKTHQRSRTMSAIGSVPVSPIVAAAAPVQDAESPRRASADVRVPGKSRIPVRERVTSATFVHYLTQTKKRDSVASVVAAEHVPSSSGASPKKERGRVRTRIASIASRFSGAGGGGGGGKKIGV